MASTMPNIFGATSTTEDVLSGTDLRGKRILGLTTPFGFHSTATEVAAGVDLTGKRVIVTGGAAGIGIETVRTLALERRSGYSGRHIRWRGSSTSCVAISARAALSVLAKAGSKWKNRLSRCAPL